MIYKAPKSQNESVTDRVTCMCCKQASKQISTYLFSAKVSQENQGALERGARGQDKQTENVESRSSLKTASVWA